MKAKYLIIGLTLLTLGSCDDYLEVSPSTDVLKEEAITSVRDAENALNGIYSELANRYYYGGEFQLGADLKGNDLRSGSYGSGWLDTHYSYSQRAYNADDNFYQEAYKVLNYINSLIDGLSKVQYASSEKPSIDNIMGQAIALRALVHFDLAREYAPAYASLGKGKITANADGIVIADKVIDPTEKPVRKSTVETYNSIVNDLKNALSMLPKGLKPSTTQGEIDYYGVEALLARAYLYMDKNDDALTLAKDVIDNSGRKLIARSQYLTSWETTFSSESLFELYVTETDNAGRYGLGYYTSPTGYAEVVATTDLVDAFDQANDVRYELLTYTAPKGKSYKEYYINAKYPNQLATQPKVLRLSEVYLIAAEAAIKTSNQTDADKYLNALRDQRIQNNVAVVATLSNILQERRFELFGEGHRAWDLWRNQLDMVRYTSDDEKTAKDHTDNIDAELGTGVIKFDDFLALHPYSFRERTICPDLQQNPGY